MKTGLQSFFLLCIIFLQLGSLNAYESYYKIYQFPTDKIPVIDGKKDDWNCVPDSYIITSDSLVDNSFNYESLDKSLFDIKVKVGWVNGLDRLYFLVEIWDDCWIYEKSIRCSDIFEVVVDGDRSGGPFINSFYPFLDKNNASDRMNAYMSFHGRHAQNYHIFTPAPEGKDWAMVWGPQSWIKDFPFSNSAISYDFSHGEGGHLVLEFWITPFDYCSPNGIVDSVVSHLEENKIIGLTWAFMDYDSDVVDPMKLNAFWSLSKNKNMHGDASGANAFKLMPIEKNDNVVKADFTEYVIDDKNRVVAFVDKSDGKIKEWLWDFGDGNISKERNPIHKYEKPGMYNVVLTVTTGEETKQRIKPWVIAFD